MTSPTPRPRPRRPASALALLAALLLSACAPLAPTPVTPMATLAGHTRGPAVARGLLVMLPGVGDRATTFADRDLLDDAAELAPELDALAADAHFGYYTHEVLMERLETDVIGPALTAGYRQVWLLGISLGGLGATAYASLHPEQIDGVVLLGPYLGDASIERSVMAAGELAAWDPASYPHPAVGPARQRRIWTWLQQQTGPTATSDVFLGYGEDDGPGTLDEVLWNALPPERRVSRPGGHRWSVWRPLARELLPLIAARAAERAAAPSSDQDR